MKYSIIGSYSFYEILSSHDELVIGKSNYGEYYLYNLKNGDGSQYSFFAPPDVHEKLKKMKKGYRFKITKTAETKGSKTYFRYEVAELLQPEQPTLPLVPTDDLYEVMLKQLQRSS